MQILKLKPVVTVIMNMFDSMPSDVLHDVEYDIEMLSFRVELAAFHQACRVLLRTHGVELSEYYVSEISGYRGSYLN